MQMRRWITGNFLPAFVSLVVIAGVLSAPETALAQIDALESVEVELHERILAGLRKERRNAQAEWEIAQRQCGSYSGYGECLRGSQDSYWRKLGEISDLETKENLRYTNAMAEVRVLKEGAKNSPLELARHWENVMKRALEGPQEKPISPELLEEMKRMNQWLENWILEQEQRKVPGQLPKKGR